MMGNIYLDNNGSQVASAHIDSTRTGQLVYTGLLNPDDNISLRFYAYADVATFDGGTLSGNKSVMVEFHDWSISVAAIPEPETYSMLLAGLGLLGFAARRRKQKEAALA